MSDKYTQIASVLREKVAEMNLLFALAYDLGMRMDVTVSGSAWVSRKSPVPVIEVKDVCVLVEEPGNES